jgi:hypothetical protein
MHEFMPCKQQSDLVSWGLFVIRNALAWLSRQLLASDLATLQMERYTYAVHCWTYLKGTEKSIYGVNILKPWCIIPYGINELRQRGRRVHVMANQIFILPIVYLLVSSLHILFLPHYSKYPRVP